MDTVSLLIRTFGIMAATLALLVIGLIVFMNLWAKRRTSNMLIGVFLEQRQIYSKLLPIRIDKVVMGRGDAKEEYLLDTTKQFWSMWPSGLPQVFQVPVRAHLYVRNCPEPLDPSNPVPTMSSRSMHMLHDEAFLRSTWKDVREATGVGAIKGKSSQLGLILIFINLVVTGLVAYFIMQIKTLLGG